MVVNGMVYFNTYTAMCEAMYIVYVEILETGPYQ